jgi:hypothetical protein
MAQTHIHKMEATWNEAHQDVFATWTEVKFAHKEHNFRMQNNIQTNLHLRNTTAEYGSHSNMEILECLQSEALRMIA